MNHSLPPSHIRKPWIVFVVIFVIILAAGVIWTVGQGPIDRLPHHQNVDGIFYDNIGLNLAGGHGFTVNFRKSAWRDRYGAQFIRSGPAKDYEWVVQFQGSGATTMRSPGYPFALSLIVPLPRLAV